MFHQLDQRKTNIKISFYKRKHTNKKGASPKSPYARRRSPSKTTKNKNEIKEESPAESGSPYATRRSPTTTKIKNVGKQSPTDTVSTRQQAIVKKRERQEAQATAMKKLRDETVKKANVGSVVSIQMDYRDVPHPNALLGIAFKVGNNAAGGVQVVTINGIICKSGKQVYYIPKTRYNVLDAGETVLSSI